jgi:hypothetical protein
MTFSLSLLANITNPFGNWLSGIAKNDVGQVRVGICAII